MALREKLRERVQPHLEPGEQVQAVFYCQTGPSPWFIAVSAFILVLGSRYFVVAATDRRYIVLKASMWVPSKPKAFDRQLPRNTQIGPLTGLWGGGSTFLGKRTHIHKRFHKDIEAADAAIVGRAVGYGYLAPAAPTSPAAGWYPDPEDATRQRYWDGTAWTDHWA
jgi:hypothetical protein